MVGCSDDGQTIVGRWSDGRLEARTFERLDRGMVEDTVGDLGGRTVRRSDGWAIAGVLCQTAGYWVGRSDGWTVGRWAGSSESCGSAVGKAVGRVRRLVWRLDGESDTQTVW